MSHELTKYQSNEGQDWNAKFVGGAKFGLAMFALFVVSFATTTTVDSTTRSTLGDVTGVLWIVSGLLVAVAALITGIQKGRMGLGVVCMLVSPIGFFFALFAENRKVKK